MNTNLNNEDFPRLTPPDVVYEHKASLKKPLIVPLYAKITAAAAAVALLFGIFWFRISLPEMELMAELKPIKAERIESNESVLLTESQSHFTVPKKVVKTVAPKRAELPMLAELQPKTATPLTEQEFQSEPMFLEGFYYASNDMPLHEQYEDDYDDKSLISRGIYKVTEGEHDSFSGILSEGLQSFKGEMASLAMTIQSSRSQLRQKVR